MDYSPWAGKESDGTERLTLSLLPFLAPLYIEPAFSGSSDSKESVCNVGDLGSIPGLGKIPWRRKWQPTPVFLLRESQWTEEEEEEEE